MFFIINDYNIFFCCGNKSYVILRIEVFYGLESIFFFIEFFSHDKTLDDSGVFGYFYFTDRRLYSKKNLAPHLHAIDKREKKLGQCSA